MQVIAMYTPKQVDGQTYSNRIRLNVAAIMESRGLAGGNGLPNMTAAGLYKFMSGRSDITVTRAQLLADDLGVSLPELLAHTIAR